MKTHINMLPLALQKQHLLHKFRSIWIRMLFVGLTLGLCNYGWTKHQYRESCQRLLESEQLVHPVITIDDTNLRLTNEINQLKNRLEECSRLEQASTPVAMLGLIGQCFAAVERPIRLDSLRVDVATTAPTNNMTQGASPVNHIKILMIGTACDDASISAVMMQLRATGVFELVELEGSQAISQADQQRRNFQIRCQI